MFLPSRQRRLNLARDARSRVSSTVADATREYSPPIPWVETLSLPKTFAIGDYSFFALEGRWILAGGGATGSGRPILGAPAGALDVTEFDEIFQDRAPVRRLCRGAKAIMAGIPVVLPPANLLRASSAKTQKFS